MLVNSLVNSKKFRNSIKYLYLATVAMFSIATISDDVQVEKNGSYFDKEHVAMYIYEYDELPNNYIHKSESAILEGNELYLYSTFRNDEGILPTDAIYTEAYINAFKDDVGEERLVFTIGTVYYTEDHYESFELLTTNDIQRSYRIWLFSTSAIAISGPASVTILMKKNKNLSFALIKQDTIEDIEFIKNSIDTGYEKVKNFISKITE